MSDSSEDLAQPDDNERAALIERLKRTFDLLSPADLAALRGVDERTLAVERSQGCGPDYVKLGRAVYYRGADIKAWIDMKVQMADRSPQSSFARAPRCKTAEGRAALVRH
jgi:hypothetical protein